VIYFKPINPRICTIRIKGKFFNYTLINAHTPIKAADEKQKEEFYDALGDIYDRSPKNDVKIVLGDMDVQIEQEHEYLQHFLEPEGSIPCSQEPSTGPYPKPYQSTPSHLSKIHFNIVHPPASWSS
jgi:hypothetical protein